MWMNLWIRLWTNLLNLRLTSWGLFECCEFEWIDELASVQFRLHHALFLTRVGCSIFATSPCSIFDACWMLNFCDFAMQHFRRVLDAQFLRLRHAAFLMRVRCPVFATSPCSIFDVFYNASCWTLCQIPGKPMFWKTLRIFKKEFSPVWALYCCVWRISKVSKFTPFLYFLFWHKFCTHIIFLWPRA